MKKFTVKFKKLDPSAIIPSFKNEKDSGFDLHSTHDGIIKFGEITVIKTGLAIELPESLCILSGEPEFVDGGKYSSETFNPSIDLTPELQLRPRSGLALKEGITIVNTPATVDNGYRGEIMIITTRLKSGEYCFSKGERIAQGVIGLVLSTNCLIFKETDMLSRTERGDGGFGKSGKF
jgi:dUTP pyrophosphatase